MSEINQTAPEGGAGVQMETVGRLAQARLDIMREVGKVIIGQDDVIEQILTAFFSRGHCLLIGVPGLGKTLLVKTLASVLDLEANRIQFTPDLMPADIPGRGSDDGAPGVPVQSRANLHQPAAGR